MCETGPLKLEYYMVLFNKDVDKNFITSLGYTEAEYSAAYKRLYPLMK